jgi:hypothetical protein
MGALLLLLVNKSARGKLKFASRPTEPGPINLRDYHLCPPNRILDSADSFGTRRFVGTPVDMSARIALAIGFFFALWARR